MKGQRKKAHWAKQRVLNAEKREAEKKANTARKPRKRAEFVELRPRTSKFVISEGMTKIANAPSADPVMRKVKPVREVKRQMSDEDYALREHQARLEIERKKKQVAPMANKMGYQYIGDAPPEIIETLGRKV